MFRLAGGVHLDPVVSFDEEAKVGKQAALAVGLTVASCGFFAGSISGASMNPARSIPPRILGDLLRCMGSLAAPDAENAKPLPARKCSFDTAGVREMVVPR
jgi:glycerol uptake facilitator-like aquaporin